MPAENKQNNQSYLIPYYLGYKAMALFPMQGQTWPYNTRQWPYNRGNMYLVYELISSLYLCIKYVFGN